MAARDLITLDELELRLARLDESRARAEKEFERLSDLKWRIEHLEWLSENAFSLQAIAAVRCAKDDDELLKDFYDDIELKVTVDKDASAMATGVFGSQCVEVLLAASTHCESLGFRIRLDPDGRKEVRLEGW